MNHIRRLSSSRYNTITMALSSLVSTQKMVTGYEIPIIGFGVYQTPPDVTERVTVRALEIGYRHIDSAKYYQNEKECAEAMRKSGIDRSKIFYTSKIPVTHMGYENAKEALAASFADAKLDYIDLMLIHGPYGGREGRLGAWRALVEAQREGKIRSIGVSNYGIRHLEELEDYIKNGGGGQISVGQYELHPWCGRVDLCEWLRRRNVVIQAYSPLVQATRMNEPSLQKLAKKHNKTPAQVLLRWSLQKGLVPLPKSVTDSRIIENGQVFDFELSQEDVDSLTTDVHAPVCWDPANNSKL